MCLFTSFLYSEGTKIFNLSDELCKWKSSMFHLGRGIPFFSFFFSFGGRVVRYFDTSWLLVFLHHLWTSSLGILRVSFRLFEDRGETFSHKLVHIYGKFSFWMTCSEHELACCPFLIINLLYSSKFCLSMQNMQVFSHPEVQLGFHPDAGASFYLSRLPGYLGDITVMPFWFCAICFSPSTSRLRSVRIVLWFSFWISYSWILETWCNCELRC